MAGGRQGKKDLLPCVVTWEALAHSEADLEGQQLRPLRLLNAAWNYGCADAPFYPAHSPCGPVCRAT
eukprot:12748775-Alexandrium_andersonii.AAC.1